MTLITDPTTFTAIGPDRRAGRFAARSGRRASAPALANVGCDPHQHNRPRPGRRRVPLRSFRRIDPGARVRPADAGGTILAVVLSRRATRPQRTFVVTTVALTALSIIPDVLADATPRRGSRWRCRTWSPRRS